MRALSFRRFGRVDAGAAVIGRGWLLRVGRLRLIWGPTPDPALTTIEVGEAVSYQIEMTYQ